MNMRMLLPMAIMCSTVLSAAEQESPFLFDREGQASQTIQEQLQIIGIEPSTDLHENPYHVLNVNKALDKFYQRDFEYYKNGGRISEHSLSFEQATQFLNLENERYNCDRVPVENNPEADVLFPTGVATTMRRRMRALALLKEQGFGYRNICFVISRNDLEPVVRESVTEKSDLIGKTLVNYAVQPTTEDAIRVLREDGFSKEYYVVADNNYAPQFVPRSEAILNDGDSNDYRCLGAACAEEDSWLTKMKDYGYLEAADEQEATIAFALSQLNFKARAASDAVTRLEG